MPFLLYPLPSVKGKKQTLFSLPQRENMKWRSGTGTEKLMFIILFLGTLITVFSSIRES
jgi:hypothetical protein